VIARMGIQSPAVRDKRRENESRRLISPGFEFASKGC